MSYHANLDDGRIIFTGEGVEPIDEENWEDIPEPPEDATVRGGEVRYYWNNGEEIFEEVERPPGPGFLKPLRKKFEEWEGSLSDALDRMDELFRKYPTAKAAITEGQYFDDEEVFDVFKNRVDKMVSNGDLEKSEGQDLKDIIEGKV